MRSFAVGLAGALAVGSLTIMAIQPQPERAIYWAAGVIALAILAK